jgi:hypothetical protein
MKTFDIYGFQGLEIGEVKARLESAFAITFVEHESQFFGEYFLANRASQESYKLYLNWNGEDFHEEEKEEFTVLLNIDYLQDQDEFLRVNGKQCLGATPLYRRQIDGKVARSFRFQNEWVLVSEKLLR